jgi:hypothetical protein
MTWNPIWIFFVADCGTKFATHVWMTSLRVANTANCHKSILSQFSGITKALFWQFMVHTGQMLADHIKTVATCHDERKPKFLP